MKKIWKVVVQPDSSLDGIFAISVQMPIGSRAISVGKQGDKICVWYEVETTASMGIVQLLCVGTGHGCVPDQARFIGTVVDDSWVWHFYVPID